MTQVPEEMSTMPPEVQALIFQLMEASANERAWIHEQLQVSYERDRKRMSEYFAAFYDAIMEIPPMIRSAHLDDLLYEWASARSLATLWGAEPPPGLGLA